ncbi:MAG: hypothetical protein GC159_12990 [Phycisphaera sp.]|nr:hypothetical protein [Phycisphaera sp.]
MSDFFLDIWTFAISQLGLVCVGILIGSWWGNALRREVNNLINRIDPGTAAPKNPGTSSGDQSAKQE